MGGKYLRIVKPNGGEEFWLGEETLEAAIHWEWVGFDSNEAIDRIKILLMDKKLNKTWVIEDSISPRKEHFPPYAWKVATVKSVGPVPPGSDYVIRIETLDGQYHDESNGTFAISEKRKLLITWPPRPPGWLWQDLHKGDKLVIKWKWTNKINTTLKLSLVTYVPEERSMPIRVIWTIKENIQPLGYVMTGGNEGGWTWVVGETHPINVGTGKYVIRLSSTDGQYWDKSGPINIVPLDSYTLIPQTIYVWSRHITWRHPIIGAWLYTRGLGTEQPEQGEIFCGFKNYHHDGTFEDDWVQIVSGGFLVCDLQDLKDKIEKKEYYGKLEKATLQMRGHEVSASGGDTAFNTYSCGAGFWVLDAPPSNIETPGTLHTEIPMGQDENDKVKWDHGKITIDVTSIIQTWLDESRPNHGLLLCPLMTSPGGNDQCLSRYTEPVLTIELKP